MKKIALVIAAAAAIFAAVPASAQGMHRDGVRHGGMHRGPVHRMGRPHARAPRIVVVPRGRHHRSHRGHMMR
jgi:hypothetical protein